jgi:eukaryotic-like serine/threonine-protein kinase
MTEREFPRRFGKYVLLDRLNSGGMAEVYLANVSGIASFTRQLAIKCMKPDLASDQQFAAMFVDEANLAGQLTHANIAQIYELGRYKDQLYIAMELVRGRDLRHICRRVKNLGSTIPLGFVAYVIAKAAEGLDYAHRRTGTDGSPLRLVHRDVSPQNILVSYEGEVKVVDFGIAKANQRTSETQSGVLKGKFSYMAPEQIRGEEIDRRADIFTLGAVLFELVALRKLFDGDNDYAVIERVRGPVLPDFRAVMPSAPPELLSVLSTALAGKPEQRFQYASEMAKALEPLLIDADRSIFGTLRASAYMRDLYVDEIESHKNRHYEEVREDDASSAAKIKGEVFRSAFDSAGQPNELAPLWRAPTVQVSAGAVRQAMESTPAEAPGSGEWEVPTEERARPLLTDPMTQPRSSLAVPIEAPPLWRRFVVPAMLALAGLLGIVSTMLVMSGDDEPAASAVSAEEFGLLTVRVTGAKVATVFVNGKEIGRAPVVSHRLRSGTHTVRVVEQRRGKPEKSRSRKVVVKAGDEPVVVVMEL